MYEVCGEPRVHVSCFIKPVHVLRTEGFHPHPLSRRQTQQKRHLRFRSETTLLTICARNLKLKHTANYGKIQRKTRQITSVVMSTPKNAFQYYACPLWVEIPQKEHGTRQDVTLYPSGRDMVPDRKWHPTPCEQNDWHTLKYFLPLWSVKMYGLKFLQGNSGGSNEGAMDAILVQSL